MNRSIDLFGICAVALGSLLAVARPAAAAPTAVVPRVVRIPADSRAAAAALELMPLIDLDYGAYSWLELYERDLAKLVASGIPFAEVAEAGRIQVLGYRFDPLAEGLPELPLELIGESGETALRLIQFVGPTRGEWLDLTEALGARVLQYYPNNTYLTWSTPAVAATLENLPFVRWQGMLHPAFKINSDLVGRTGAIELVDIFFYNDGRVEATLDALKALGARIERHGKAQPDGVFQLAAVELDAAAIPEVAHLAPVVWLGYKSPELQLDDEMSDQIVAGNHPGGVPVPGYLDHLAALGFDGTGVTWAISDTGVDFDHPELGPKIVFGWSGAGACSPPGGDCASGGHGTHVAGIAGADGTTGVDDGNGFLCGLGVAPGYSIAALNVFFGSDPLEEYSKQALSGGAIGTNNSWTTGEGTCHGYQASERTFDLIVRDGNFDTTMVAEPFAVVFSAGNSGSGPCTLTAPKEAKNVIVTANSYNSRAGDIDRLSGSSSRGPAADGRLGVTIAAPGTTIYSTRNDLGGSCSSIVCGSSLHSSCSGTSMAAPHASGMAVLLADWWRSFNGGENPSPAMLKALMINTAVDMTGIGATDPIPNTDEGWGRINVTHAIAATTETDYWDQIAIFDNTGEIWELTVPLDDPGQPLKVSLTWTDAPGAVGANPALVNDLDLEVIHDGNTYRGNVFSGGWSIPGGTADPLNNLESVFIQSPGATTATVRVIATNIAGDGVPYIGDATDQDFALVCSNCVAGLIFADGFESGDTSVWTSSVP